MIKKGSGKMDENKVLSFIDQVQQKEDDMKRERDYENSTDAKLKKIEDEKQKATDVCLDMVFSSIYKNALPLSDDYKVSHGEDIDAEIKNFIINRCPKGVEYYVKEGIKKGSNIAEKIMESVNKIVEDKYFEKELNVENELPESLVFKMDNDMQRKVDVIGQDLSMDAISDIIKDNVKATAQSEITRAKKEKEDIKQLESELANDINITNESQIEEILEERGFTEIRDFVPSLFEGIMIGKLNKLQTLQECRNMEPVFLFDALSEFGLESTQEESPIEQIAFVEAVKELTMLNIVHALKLESFTHKQIVEMANDYASEE